MNENINEFINKTVSDGASDAFFTDCRIIRYILENVEISFPPERSFSFKINTDWHLKTLSGKRASAVAEESGEGELLANSEAFAFAGYSDWGHTSTSWEEVLSLGIFGIAERVFERERAADEREKAYFSELSRVFKCVLAFVERSAKEAARCGRESLSEMLFAMTKRAPKSLDEALVTILLYYNLHQEIENTPLRTVGRLDTILYPFFSSAESDSAFEKLVLFMGDLDAIRFSANLPFALGGTDKDGNSLVNELSYIILDAFASVASPNVKLHILTSENTPDKFILRAFEIIRGGYNSIVFLSDETVIKSLLRLGMSESDARAYHVVGCYECLADGEIGSTCGATVNIQKAVEYTLFGGYDNLFGKQISHEGRTDFESFDELLSEFDKHLKFICDCAMRLTDIYEKDFAKIHSSPIYTAANAQTLNSAKDVFAGGARYKNTSLNAIGLATAADSLVAIKRLVFDEGRLTLKALSDILKSNWEGEEILRLTAKKKLPKFGTANTEVDSVARHIVDLLDTTVNRRPNRSGGVYRLGTFSIDWRWRWGERTAASADGRLCSEPLSQNTSASFGSDVNGVSAHLLSVASLDGTKTPNGSIVDIDLHSTALSGEDGLRAALGSLRAYFKKGGFAVHYNVLDTATLRCAQECPEEYPNLQIRLCGWNVRFSSLSKKAQDEFIKRSEK